MFEKLMIPSSVSAKSEKGNEELFVFEDEAGFILTKDQVIHGEHSLMDIINKAIAFYDAEGAQEWIERVNKIKAIKYFSSMSHDEDFKQNENGKFIIPEVNMRYKEFRSNLKRDWSFKCDWCGKKVSSKTDTHYYTLNFPQIPGLMSDYFKRGCSEVCANSIWKDEFKKWIYDNEYQDFFEL
ncbi:hypothetical protein [Salimicrobium halophilum]|uniref:Uncharacterized protein n=1 Tax=Salimicrobium halophilum TaxID=86666 RepID=A0A1G8W7D9_9BACI|nr:hypothetical protein [Salimicrobium halophilum]SDJ74053.1 hypothetical protein SAMN04490247_3060 [Salimicrobium halophilum]